MRHYLQQKRGFVASRLSKPLQARKKARDSHGAEDMRNVGWCTTGNCGAMYSKNATTKRAMANLVGNRRRCKLEVVLIFS
jgi:hypothetical protein